MYNCPLFLCVKGRHTNTKVTQSSPMFCYTCTCVKVVSRWNRTGMVDAVVSDPAIRNSFMLSRAYNIMEQDSVRC